MPRAITPRRRRRASGGGAAESFVVQVGPQPPCTADAVCGCALCVGGNFVSDYTEDGAVWTVSEPGRHVRVVGTWAGCARPSTVTVTSRDGQLTFELAEQPPMPGVSWLWLLQELQSRLRPDINLPERDNEYPEC